MSFSRVSCLRVFLALLMISATSAITAQTKKQPPPPPARAKSPVPAVTDEYVHKEFGDNCSLLAGPPQIARDLDGDGVVDVVVAAPCKNPMAEQAEHWFPVAVPFDCFSSFGALRGKLT